MRVLRPAVVPVRASNRTGRIHWTGNAIGAALLSLAPFATLIGTPTIANAQDTRPVLPESRSYTIAAGPLSRTLTQFASEAGIEVSVDAGMTDGITSPGLSGSHTVQSGLAALLAGTGLEALQRGNGEFTLRKAPVQASVLPAVRVEASIQTEQATGPVAGYRARKSRTASIHDADVLDTPVSVQVVPAELLADQRAIDLPEALRNISSIKLNANDFNVGSQVNQSVRGFSTTTILRNGARVSNVGTPPVAAVERIEVLKGPNSLYYGQLSPGGVLNLVSKRPLNEATRTLGLTFGPDNTLGVDADVSAPILSDKVLFRMVGSYFDSETYLSDGLQRVAVLAPSLTLRPIETLKIDLGYEYALRRVKPIVSATALVGPDFRVDPRFDRDTQYQAPWAFKETIDQYAYALVEYDLATDTQLRVGHHYFGRTLEEQTLRFANGISEPDAFRTFYTYRGKGANQSDLTLSIISLIHAFSFSDTRHSLAIGADRRRDARAPNAGDFNLQGYAIAFDNPNLDALVRPDPDDPPEGAVVFEPFPGYVANREWGLFLQDDIWIGERLKLVAGLRYNEIKTQTFDADLSLQKNDKLSPSAAVLYKLRPATSIYGSWGTSFEPVAGRSRTNQVFEPTEGSQYEIGAKQQFLDGRASVNAALFTIKQSKALTPDPLDADFSVQDRSARSRGLEVEVQGSMTSALDVFGSLTWLEAETTRSNVVDEVGKQLANVPPLRANLWSKQRIVEARYGTLSVAAGIYHESARFGNALNTGKLPANTTVDLAAYFDTVLFGQAVRSQINVSNVFDEEYIQTSFGNYGTPRTIRMQISTSF